MNIGGFNIGGDGFFYDVSGGSDMTIGGTCCHLCGAEKSIETTYHTRNKRHEWKTKTCSVYACCTSVTVDAKGRTKVTVGEKCISL